LPVSLPSYPSLAFSGPEWGCCLTFSLTTFIVRLSTRTLLPFNHILLLHPRLAMNIDKCVALHNQILKHGWLGSGRTIEDFEQECKTWFDLWGDEAEALRNTLSPDLVAFLERAYATHADHSFFYYVSGLDYPSGLFEAAECISECYSQDDRTRYVVLYHMNRFGSHNVGLV
jgi:hypothetical protein